MPKDYKPPRDAADVFARYKAHYEGERELKPAMLEFADRELKAGATVGQLAKLTGLTPEVFRRRARALGIEHKRAPTVGKLRPEHAPPAPPREPDRSPAPERRPRPAKPQPTVEERPLTEEEAKTLAELVRSRATPLQLQGLEQDVSGRPDGLKDFIYVSSAMGMGLLTHDEVYGDGPERPAGSEEQR